jgi:hypothetical protein
MAHDILDISQPTDHDLYTPRMQRDLVDLSITITTTTITTTITITTTTTITITFGALLSGFISTQYETM